MIHPLEFPCISINNYKKVYISYPHSEIYPYTT